MTRRLAVTLYLGAITLMAALLAVLWLAPGPLAGWRHWQAPAPQAPKLDDVQAALLQANPAAAAAYPVVLARPLFDPARRPPAPAPVNAASAPPPAPSVIEQAKLQGVIAGPTLSGVMLEEGGQSRFVRVGEAVGDWTLKSVQGRQAVFARRGQQRVLDWAAPSGESAAPGTPAAKKAAAPPPARPAPAAAVTVPAAPRPQAQPVPVLVPQAAPKTPSAASPARGSFGGGSARTSPSNRPSPSAPNR